jgi:hypothetical protein
VYELQMYGSLRYHFNSLLVSLDEPSDAEFARIKLPARSFQVCVFS